MLSAVVLSTVFLLPWTTTVTLLSSLFNARTTYLSSKPSVSIGTLVISFVVDASNSTLIDIVLLLNSVIPDGFVKVMLYVLSESNPFTSIGTSILFKALTASSSPYTVTVVTLGVIDLIDCPNAKSPFGTTLISTVFDGDVIVNFASTVAGTVSTSTISPLLS